MQYPPAFNLLRTHDEKTAPEGAAGSLGAHSARHKQMH